MTDKPEEGKAQDENWYVLIAGLPRLAEPVGLTSGLTLRPLQAPLTVFDLAAAGAAGFRGWSALESIAAACTCEIESIADSGSMFGYDTLNRAWLASALLVLRGFTRHLCVACCSYSWNAIAGHQDRSSRRLHHEGANEAVAAGVGDSECDLPPFHGNLLDLHLQLLVDEASREGPLQVDDAVWINQHFDTFNTLAVQSGPFRFALEASVDWRYAKDARAAISRLWAGIEAVFGISTELTYRISLLSACLLSPRGRARRDKFQQVKRLYSLRSKAVHGAELPEPEISEALTGSYSLLRDLLLLSLDRGHALCNKDFDRAVFN